MQLVKSGEPFWAPKSGEFHMRMMRFVVATCLTFWVAYGVHAQQAAQPPVAGAQGGGRAGTPRGGGTRAS